MQNIDRVNRHTHKESCEFISLDQKVRQNEQEQNQQGSLLVFPDTAQFRDNNSEKIKASPEFQSLEPEGRQEKVEQQGFQPLIVISTQENNSEQFRLISSEFPSLDHKGHQGFQSLIASSPQSKKNNSEKFKLTSPEFQSRHTHKESSEFISLDQKDRQNEQEQNQQGSLLVFPDTAQFRDNNSEKIKASPEFQSLEPEGRQEKVEQQGFQPLIVISTQENNSEQFRLISSEFPSLDHKGHQGFQSLIASSPQSKKNNSEKFKLKSPEFQRRLSLNHKDLQEKNQEQGFQPLIVSGSPSKENLSEQFKLNPRFEWPRLDQKGCQYEQEQNLQEGFQPFIDFSPPSKENNSEQFRLISSEFPSLPGFEEESKGFQLFSTQPKDQQVRFQPSNLLALEIFEQNKSIPKKDQAQFGEIGSDRFLNKPNFKSYRKPAL